MKLCPRQRLRSRRRRSISLYILGRNHTPGARHPDFTRHRQKILDLWLTPPIAECRPAGMNRTGHSISWRIGNPEARKQALNSVELALSPSTPL